LEIATGQVTGVCQDRHQEFLRFLKQPARAYPDQRLHLVMDNYAAHKRVEVRDWLTADPRVQVHFTPTSSWMNLVEVWFGIIERQAIHRGTFGNIRELTTAIKTFRRCSSATPAGLAKGLMHRSGSLYHLAPPRSALIEARSSRNDQVVKDEKINDRRSRGPAVAGRRVCY
jgi:DDE superfamily endonuclease